MISRPESHYDWLYDFPAMNDDEFPYIIRMVDRGSLLKTTGDIGGMELYGSVVVADDPYKVIGSLNEALNSD